MDDPAFCHYPAPPPPVAVRLAVIPPRPCPYLPGRIETTRAFCASRIDPLVYHEFMNASFRRSGCVIYQPTCAGCRECVPLRVPVKSFQPSKSQRRCRKRNEDLVVSIAAPEPTAEKFDLYAQYQAQWHEKAEPETYIEFVNFLYRSPVDTLEFSYRNGSGKLVGVGICDICRKSLSSVYFFFDPAESRRGLGTFGALCEIEYAARQEIDYFYLGFWIKESPKMGYKADFRPYELLQPDGVWRLIQD
jgi:arginyl-tRNA--protein-N-Asp/Glu arginylyltransferase